MKKILEFLGVNVIKDIGKVIDDIFTNDEERQRAKNELVKIIQQKELELQKMQTEIIVAEAKGNWLQRSLASYINVSIWFHSYICKVLSTIV